MYVVDKHLHRYLQGIVQGNENENETEGFATKIIMIN